MKVIKKTFDVDVRLPYVFNTAIGSELSLNIFKKGFNIYNSRSISKFVLSN